MKVAIILCAFVALAAATPTGRKIKYESSEDSPFGWGFPFSGFPFSFSFPDDSVEDVSDESGVMSPWPMPGIFKAPRIPMRRPEIFIISSSSSMPMPEMPKIQPKKIDDCMFKDPINDPTTKIISSENRTTIVKGQQITYKKIVYETADGQRILSETSESKPCNDSGKQTPATDDDDDNVTTQQPKVTEENELFAPEELESVSPHNENKEDLAA